MSTAGGPRITSDNLVLCLDAHDAKSYPGEPTENLLTSSAMDFSVLSTYTASTFTQVADGESPTGYACEMYYTGTVNASSRCRFGASTNVPTSGTAFATIWVKRTAGDSASMRPSLYTGYTWYNMDPLDGGGIYITSEYRPFGKAVTLGTNSGGPNPGFSMTYAGSTTASDKTRWIMPQLTTKSYATPFVREGKGGTGTYNARPASVDLMIHGNVGTGTTFEDSSPRKLALTNTNGVSHAGTSEFGGSALKFVRSSTQYITTSSTSDINFGTGDWTIDYWFNMNSGQTDRMHALNVGTGSVANISFNFNDGNAFWLYWNGSGTPNIIFGSDGDYGDGAWHHMAVTRASGMVRVWVDGVHKGSNNYSSSSSMGQTASLYVGAGSLGVLTWDGYLDEVRVCKGTALWVGSGNFTPPTRRNLSAPVVDRSGNGNHGDFVGGIATRVSHHKKGQVIEPKSNAYLDFDGTDDYVNLGSGSSLKPTTAITISVWVNPDSSQNTYADIGGGHQNNQGYVIQQSGASTNQYYFSYRNTSSAWVATGTTTLTAGTWQHFVITCEFGGTTKHYLNGSETVSASLSGAVYYVSSEDMFIGHGFTTARCFNGQIATYTIQSAALTAQQVKQNFNAQRGRYGI
jgi:hypothetical protein